MSGYPHVKYVKGNKAQIAQMGKYTTDKPCIKGNRTTRSGIEGKSAFEIPKEVQSAGVPAEAQSLTLLSHGKQYWISARGPE